MDSNYNHCSGERGLNSNGILYHSRMRYLKSRDGQLIRSSIVRKKQEYKKISHEKKNNYTHHVSFPSPAVAHKTQPQHLSILSKNKACLPEKLLPPTELMSRSQAFRRACLTNLDTSPIKKIKKMKSLHRKVKPSILAKREEIYSKIRAAEISAERIRKEEEKRQSSFVSRNSRCSGLIGANVPSKVFLGRESEISISEEGKNITLDKLDQYDNSPDMKEVDLNSNNSHEKGSYKFRARKTNEENSDDDEGFPGLFSFINDWKP